MNHFKEYNILTLSQDLEIQKFLARESLQNYHFFQIVKLLKCLICITSKILTLILVSQVLECQKFVTHGSPQKLLT